jgi:hypothetical protein
MTRGNSALLVYAIGLAPWCVYAAGDLTVGDKTYSGASLIKEYPQSVFIQHTGGRSFIEKSKLSEADKRSLRINAENNLPPEVETAEDSTQSEEVVFEDGGKIWSYRKITSHGWTVYWESSLAKKETVYADLNDALDKSFAYMEKVIPGEALGFIKTIPVWISNETTVPMRGSEKGVIPFHRSAGWLRDHGLNPHMAPGVHVINPEPVLYEHKMFDYAPMTILHEWAHAYHNLVLTLEDDRVTNAYRNAVEQKLYLSVPDRSDPNKKAEAYANTNFEEYFAELEHFK